MLESDIRWTTDSSLENLSDLLADVSALVRRFVVVTPEQLTALSLWIAHTHVISAADCTPCRSRCRDCSLGHRGGMTELPAKQNQDRRGSIFRGFARL